ncbi:MAG: hypothetical protein HC876_07215 [Chloroflexaceae bacterium]|nr:hypothetical protein [Chloroflexaceae bacterium]
MPRAAVWLVLLVVVPLLAMPLLAAAPPWRVDIGAPGDGCLLPGSLRPKPAPIHRR